MAVSYLSGGRTLVGVVLPTYDEQQQEPDESFAPSATGSHFESEPAPPSMDWLGGISASFFIQHPTTASSAPPDIRSPRLASSPLSSRSHSSSLLLPEQEKALCMRRRDLDTDGLGYALRGSARPLDHLVELNLSHNQLTSLPQTLLQLRHLRKLVVSDNLLDTIPLVLYHMRQIQELDLSENQIRDMPAYFPQALPNLTCLYLEGNRIEALPTTVGSAWSARMRHLRLGTGIAGGNELTELPETMVEMEALEELEVVYNRLRRFSPLPPRLRHLDLSFNQLQALPGDLVHRDHPLVTLSLAKNQLAALPESLGELRSLEILDVMDNQIHVFPPGLLDQPLLHVLFTGNPVAGDHPSSQPAAASAAPPVDHEDHPAVSASPPCRSSDRAATVSSLHELALRRMVQLGSVGSFMAGAGSLPLAMPDTVQARVCLGCQGPFVQEWVVRVQVKRYRGHPRVARQVRYCSAQCAAAHAERLREAASVRQAAASSQVRRPRWEQPLQAGSLEWIYAAADAAAQDDSDGFIVEDK